MATSDKIKSNAFNFMKLVQGEVDPRTGQYSCTLSLPEFKANKLAGPDLPLKVSFNPQSTHDVGFGIGWELKLSNYLSRGVDQGVVSLHTGETFAVRFYSGNRGEIKEQKVRSFDIERVTSQQYRIIHKSGLVEVLSYQGEGLYLPTQVFSAQGRSLTLDYQTFAGQPLLKSIRDDDGVVLQLVMINSLQLNLVLYPGSEHTATYSIIKTSNHTTTEFVLPGQTASGEQASWRFGYKIFPSGEDDTNLVCLSSLASPHGGKETIEYASEPHVLPGTTFRLPRVYRHVQTPGQGQVDIETRYTYGADQHNFLGNMAEIGWVDDGLDMLYRTKGNYTYETTQTLWDSVAKTPLSSSRRIYNRFHLLLTQELQQRASDGTPGFVTHDCRNRYHLLDDTDFGDQPNKCQLPYIATQMWYQSDAVIPRHMERVITDYDDAGNLTSRIDDDGITTLYEWYPAEGEGADCPPDPLGFTRTIKRRTIVPAVAEFDTAPVVTTHYRHAALATLAGGTPARTCLVMTEEITSQLTDPGTLKQLRQSLERYASNPEQRINQQLVSTLVDGLKLDELRRVSTTFIDDPADRLRHALASRVVETLFGNSAKPKTSEYLYTSGDSSRRYKKAASIPVLRTVSTMIGFDDSPAQNAAVRKSHTLEYALHSGFNILWDDGDGSGVAKEFDSAGRPTAEVAAPDSAYQALRIYSYVLCNGSGQQAQLSVTDAKGVETRSWLDGLGRTIREERMDKDLLGGSAVFRDTYTAEYNRFGQLASETEIDWEDNKDVPLKRSYAYNAWGDQYKVIGPDGVAHLQVKDPSTLSLRSWTESSETPPQISNLTLSRINAFGKADRTQMLDASGSVLSERQMRYDGLGNCIEAIDEKQRVTRYRYDVFSRLYETLLPNRDRIVRTFAEHSEEDLPVSIAAGTSIGQLPAYGRQSFDGLHRRTSLQVGPRVQTFEYTGGQSQASKTISASQKSIHYEYQPGLVDTPTSSQVDGEELASIFDYDRVTGHLTQSSSSQGTHRFEYNSSGHLLSESWEDLQQKNNGAPVSSWQTSSTHTLNGRLLTRTDIDGLQTVHKYDQHGRIEQVTQGMLTAEYSYDSLGRVATITAINKVSKDVEVMSISTLSFDSQDREVLRTVEVAGEATRTISQGFRRDNRLDWRELKVAGTVALLETFSYDHRGRLDIHTCKGPALPTDRAGKAYSEQQFSYDEWSNIAYTFTQFADGSTEESYSSFAANDPCQLVSIQYLVDGEPSEEVRFEYDTDGNLLYDEHGRSLHYDSQHRLTHVTDAQGKVLSQYRYDAHNHLLGVIRHDQPETLRFYDGDNLSTTVQGDKKIHYLYNDDQPLGQQTVDAPEQNLLLLTDSRNTVLGEKAADASMRVTTYGLYGERNPQQPLQCLLGFNGEVRDELGGWYLLGKGYRAYNPWLRRFHSVDSYSPFGAGGINPYMYCEGDPVNFRDPSGHASDGFWGGLLSVLGIVLTVASVVIFPIGGVVGAAFTIGFGAYGLYTSYTNLAAAINSGTRSRKEDRELEGKKALSGGIWDAIGGALGIVVPAVLAKAGKAITTAIASRAAKAAAETPDGIAATKAAGRSVQMLDDIKAVSTLQVRLPRAKLKGTTPPERYESLHIKGLPPEVPPKPLKNWPYDSRLGDFNGLPRVANTVDQTTPRWVTLPWGAVNDVAGSGGQLNFRRIRAVHGGMNALRPNRG